ncbi:MAG: hypothetical protein AAFO29_19680, partial [Actinomycetota bacterium]
AAVEKWVAHWTERGYEVADYPAPIPDDRFNEEYPEVLRAFFERLDECDVLFVMNEDRKGVTGYVGPATFAELSYAVVRNVRRQRSIQIIVLQPVGDDVHGRDEIRLWHDLGWITFHSNP